MNECEVYRLDRGGKLCLHECVNVPGSYRCSCPSGYKLLPDGRSCEGEWQDGVEDKRSFAGFRMVGLPAHFLAEGNSCDCESGSFTSRGERSRVNHWMETAVGLNPTHWTLWWVLLLHSSIYPPNNVLTPIYGGTSFLWGVSSSAIWSCSPSVVEVVQGIRWGSHWEESVGMSSRAETLRQTRDKLEGLDLPSSPGTPLCLRTLPPCSRPGQQGHGSYFICSTMQQCHYNHKGLLKILFLAFFLPWARRAYLLYILLKESS